MTNEKTIRLIMELASKTSSSAVSWEQTVDDDVYAATFPNFTVQLSYRRSRETPAAFDYVLSIFNNAGQLIQEVSDVDLHGDWSSCFPETSAYSIMKELYANARNVAMGVDAALDELLDYLK